MFNGNALKRIRERECLTQMQFCELLGITQSYLSKLESGKKDPPLELFREVERIFHVEFELKCVYKTSRIEL